MAVRSSGTSEDPPEASFAGQGDTYLWTVGTNAVVDRVRDCWASLFTARAMAYREKRNLAHTEQAMAVGVEQMVHARAAGVASQEVLIHQMVTGPKLSSSPFGEWVSPSFPVKRRRTYSS